MMVFDVGVIGGGVIGLSCAWRLAQAGARVAVFERGEIGHEASWAAAGMLAPQCEAAHHPPSGDKSSTRSRQAMLELCLQSRSLYAAFADELFEATGIDIELSLSTHSRHDWRRPGILYVDNSDVGNAFEAFALQKESGLAVESAGEFNGFPALWLPDEGQVENRKLATALGHAAQHAGAEFFFGETRVVDGAVCCDNALVTCDKIVLCAGAWSGEELWPLRLPVRPVAGQMLVLQAAQTVQSVIYSESVYLVPRRDGRLLVGATVEDVGFRKAVTSEGTQALWDAARGSCS
jgi:glycine oxidase